MSYCRKTAKQKVKSLLSSCDGISSCVFLKDDHLATTSFNGQIETWDIGNGCRWEDGFKGNVQNVFSSFVTYLQMSWCLNKLLRVSFRTALIEAHTNAITASAITADMQHMATVSLDSMLKVGATVLCLVLNDFILIVFFFCGQVWSATKGSEVAAWLSPGPLNCVCFHPEDHLLAAGCWNGNVIMWNWLQNKSEGVSSQPDLQYNS